MSRRLLDTNILCVCWRRTAPWDLSTVSEEDARRWARNLIEFEETNAVASPVVLEILGGVRTKRELVLTETFLSEFRVIDNGKVLREDWDEAKRSARRVPPDGKPRDLGDCLIQSIAKRLRYDVRTFDRRFRDHRRRDP